LHQKKVREWFMNPVKHASDIEKCQSLHPGKCIYHLTKSHPTEKCGVKKECDEQVATRKAARSSSSPTSAVGQLRHVTEESFVDAETEEVYEPDLDTTGNDTNEASLMFFSRISKCYLRIVKSSSRITPVRHEMSYPVIADSGANYHRFKDREFFISMTPAKGTILLGDGKTTLDIKGVGTVRCKIDDFILDIPQVHFVPELGESIYSLHLHIKTPQHGLESSYENGLFVKFPHFQTKAIIGGDDIYLDMIPVVSDSKLFHNSTVAEPEISSNFYRQITQLTSDINVETEKIDNIVQDLRKYYSTIKTKRQLGLNVPAGFRHDTNHQQQIKQFSPPRKLSELDQTTSSTESSEAFDSLQLLSSMMISSSNDALDVEHSTSVTNQSSSQLHIPIVRSVDKASSLLPQNISMTEDFLRACVGFRRVDTLKKNISTLYQSTI
jgi:hypothetical protein